MQQDLEFCLCKSTTFNQKKENIQNNSKYSYICKITLQIWIGFIKHINNNNYLNEKKESFNLNTTNVINRILILCCI
jgi:hypothetical protein